MSLLAPPPNHAESLRARLADLPEEARHLIYVLSIYHSEVEMKEIKGLAAALHQYRPQIFGRSVGELVTRLSSSGVIVHEGSKYSVGGPYAETATRMAVEEGFFDAVIKPLKGYKSVDPWYVTSETRVRDLRIAVYRGEVTRFFELLTSHRFWGADVKFYRRYLLQPRDPKWISKLPVKIFGHMLRILIIGEMRRGKELAPLLEMLSDLCAHKDVAQWGDYPFLPAEILMMRGRFDDAEALLQEKGRTARDQSLLAGIRFLRGDRASALEGYTAALKKYRRESSKKAVFDGFFRALYPFLLLSKQDPEHSREAQRYSTLLAKNSDVGEHLVNLCESITCMGRKGYSRSGTSGLHPCASFFNTFCVYLHDPRNQSIGELEDKMDWLEEIGFAWCRAEFARLLTEFDREPEENAILSQSLHSQMGTVSLVDQVMVDPPWRRVLHALKRLKQSEPTRQQKPDDGEQRVVWVIDDTETPRAFIQKMTKRGWNKGKLIPQKNLYDVSENEPYFTKQDFRASKAYYMRQGSKSILLDHRIAFEALVGHPLLFRDNGERVVLTRKEPELNIHRDGQYLRLEIRPKPRSDSFVLIREGYTRLCFVPINPEHHKIADLIRFMPKVPISAKEEVMDSVSALSEDLVINSEFARGGTAVEADARIQIQLFPYGEGLRAVPRIRPFGDDGPFVPAGEGGHTLFANIEGQTVVCHRDLALESANLESLLERCPTFSSVLSANDEYRLGPTEGLSLLDELQELGDEVVVHWPEGKSLTVVRPSEGVQVRVRHQNDWFAVTGQLAVDDGAVIQLKQLLELTAKHGGRFVPLEEGKYMALTHALRRRLDEYRILLGGPRAMKLHASAAESLDALTADTGNLEADDAWQENRRRLAAARELNPVLPSTLQAELRGYQEDGFRWMARLDYLRRGACLADDMGLGKTIQALSFMLSVAGEGPMLVVAPTSVCSNWEQEVARFAPILNVHRLGKGDRETQLKELGPMDLMVTSYGLLQYEGDLLAAISWRVVVLDEAQAIKNPGTKRARAAMNLVAKTRIITTGTPVENHLGELWSLFKFINPGLLGSRESFTNRFLTPIEKQKDQIARTTLKRLVRPFILRRLKSQVLDELPERTEITLHVEMSEQERNLYEAMRRQALDKLSDEEEGGAQFRILAEITRLRRACCNPKLVAPYMGVKSAKLELFGEVVEELLANHHKVLVFSQFVDHLAILREYLDGQKVSYQYLDGSTPAKQRSDRVAAFQRGEGDVFLISLKAGGTGLNLTAADYVIHMDPWWNPAVEDQASDRAHRIGQTRPVTVYRLVTRGTIEEQIMSLHGRKRDLAESLLEGTDSPGKLNAEQLMSLINHI